MPADVFDEAESIVHAVGLSFLTWIAAEVNVILFCIIDKTASGTDQDIPPAFQHFQLLIVAIAAVSRGPIFRPVACVRGSASAWICTASSRVGAMISARGWLTCGLQSLDEK